MYRILRSHTGVERIRVRNQRLCSRIEGDSRLVTFPREQGVLGDRLDPASECCWEAIHYVAVDFRVLLNWTAQASDLERRPGDVLEAGTNISRASLRMRAQVLISKSRTFLSGAHFEAGLQPIDPACQLASRSLFDHDASHSFTTPFSEEVSQRWPATRLRRSRVRSHGTPTTGLARADVPADGRRSAAIGVGGISLVHS